MYLDIQPATQESVWAAFRETDRFYLGLAALTFEDHVEQNCIDQGIAVIKQVGDTVVINDEHLKVY